MRRTVWLLDTIIRRGTHYRTGENTVPCLKPDACPWCEDSAYRQNVEGYAPALFRLQNSEFWYPIVAVFTKSALLELGEGPHRGMRMIVVREKVGAVKQMRLEHLEAIEPPVPSFSVIPHVSLMWFPLEPVPTADDIPDPVPCQTAKTFVPTPQERTPEEREAVLKLLEQHQAKRKAEAAKAAAEAQPTPNPAPEIAQDAPGSTISGQVDPQPGGKSTPLNDLQRRLADQRRRVQAVPPLRPIPRAVDDGDQVEPEPDTIPIPAAIAARTPRYDGTRDPNEVELLSMGAGAIVSRIVNASLPNGHPAKKGGAA